MTKATTITVRVEGLDDAMKRLQAMPRKVHRRVVMRSLKAGSAVLVDAAKESAPRYTGVMANSMMAKLKNTRRGAYALIGPRNKSVRGKNPNEYAHAVEGGAEPHVIMPTKAKSLKFFVPDAGEKLIGSYRYAKYVRHPGIAPRNFLRHAAIITFPRAVQAFAAVFGKGVEDEAQKGAGG